MFSTSNNEIMIMSRKRRNTSSAESSDDDEPSPKRRQVSESLSGDEYYEDVLEKPQVDLNYGMTGAFPGLSAHDSDYYGPAVDGIDYLRMVRSEAKHVPHILTASVPQSKEIHEEIHDEKEHGGYFFDGAYTSTVFKPSAATVLDLPPLQQKYYDQLLLRFSITRARLKLCSQISSDVSCSTTFDPHSSKLLKEWEEEILGHDPQPAQIAGLDNETVVALIAWFATQVKRWFQRYGAITRHRIGIWVWSLLAKCPDRGELGSEEIAELRVLAQEAAGVQKEEAAAIDTLGNNVSISEQENVADLASMVELDMIITIVGELYGQRDLLEFRKIWTTIRAGQSTPREAAPQ